MLQIQGKKRKDCDQIVQKLEAMKGKGERNEEYFAKPQTLESHKSGNFTVTVPNVSESGDASGAGENPELGGGPGAEENSRGRIDDRRHGRRYLRRFFSHIASFFHRKAKYLTPRQKK